MRRHMVRIFLVCRVRQLLLFVVVLLVSMFLDNSLPDTHAHTDTQSHTHTHTVAVDIWKPHGKRSGFSVNIFSKQQAAHSIFLVPHVRVYFRYHCTCTPQNSLHVCTHQTPDTHTSRHKYTHTHLKHMHCFVQLILLIFFLRCISVSSSLR